MTNPLLKYALCVLLTLCLMIPAHAADSDTYTQSTGQKNVDISTDVFAAALPLASAGISIANKDWKGLVRFSIEGVATVGVTYLLKNTVRKKRPDGSDYHSFPSMHTSVAFVSASYLMRRYGWKFGVPAYGVATYVAWGRIYAKKHDIWDVLGGAAIGTAAGLLGTTPFARKHELTIAPATDGRTTIGLTASMKF